MKKLLAVLLTLCVLLTVCSGIFVYAESGDTRTGISDIYKWDFGYDSDTGTVTETNSGKHCMIQRHSGYFYHANNGCDCMDAAEVAHFNPFRLVAYSNGYNPTHSTDYIDKYVPMVQDGNCWTFIDAVDLGGLDWVSSSNVMEYFLCSSVDRGIVFTAPVSGVIEFDFYFKSISDSKADLLIGKKASMTETCDSWSGDWDRDSCIEYIEGSTADGLDSITITVEAGEEVVFLLHSNMTDGVSANFFFDEVKYVSVGELTEDSNNAEGDKIGEDDTGTEADTGDDTDTDIDTDTDVDINTDTDVDINTDTDVDINTDTDADDDAEYELDINEGVEDETNGEDNEELGFFGKIFAAIGNFFKSIWDWFFGLFS